MNDDRPETRREGYWVFTHSEAGGHPINEDAFTLEPHPGVPSAWFGALADGQGGQTGGAEAARLACRIVVERLRPCLSKPLVEPSTWVEALRRADAAVAADPDAGFTTLIGFAVVDDRVIGASCGDSALWAADASGVIDLTHRQRKNPPVGSGAACPTSFAARLSRPWTVLAMSDGVWKFAGWDGVRNALLASRAAVLIGTLLQGVRSPLNGELPDDFTALVLHNDR